MAKFVVKKFCEMISPHEFALLMKLELRVCMLSIETSSSIQDVEWKLSIVEFHMWDCEATGNYRIALIFRGSQFFVNS